MDFAILAGKTLASVQAKEDEIVFVTDDGEIYRLHHNQHCCEDVEVEDICGDVADVIGSPVLLAEEVSNSDDPPKDGFNYDSYTWTFYKLATNKGSVTIRWFGSSNGYYSESVSFSKVA